MNAERTKCKYKVEHNAFECPPRDIEGDKHVPQLALHQNDGCRLDSNVRPCSDGNADIGLRNMSSSHVSANMIQTDLGECRGVVDAVADHGYDLAGRLQRFHFIGLVFG